MKTHPTTKWLLAAAACAACFLSGCADFQIKGAIETPYGTITSDKEGSYVVTLRPIVVEK